MKQNKGITLVALVITIIVLLILAGITIAAINGEEGIFNTAQKSTDKSTEAQALEEIKLVIYQVQTENQGKATLQQIVEKLEEDKKNTYIVTTKTQIATLTTQDGVGITDASQVTDETEAIYVTNTKYGHEVEVSSTLKVALAPVAEKGTVENNVVLLSTITEENYGDYIDIGNDLVCSESTTDDWRIFYKDDNYVYAILASYLPTTVVPDTDTTNLGITKVSNGYGYNWSGTPAQIIEKMLNEANWDFLVPNNLKGIAYATGSATQEQLTNSWNSNPKVNSSSKIPGTKTFLYLDVSGLYVLGYAKSVSPNGYWIPVQASSNGMYGIVVSSGLKAYATPSGGIGLRPVIKLPLNLQVKEGRAWTLAN